MVEQWHLSPKFFQVSIEAAPSQNSSSGGVLSYGGGAIRWEPPHSKAVDGPVSAFYQFVCTTFYL